MIQPMDVTPEVINALSDLRELRHRMLTGLIDSSMIRDLLHAITVLEGVGVFAEIDEATEVDQAEALLAESAAGDLVEERFGVRTHAPLATLNAVPKGA